ncbi:DNA/RNA non-specific endonuclease [Acinetobacter nosocomialis]|nr:DNA/RNA non-specific endonuclease [Acinetobacter nosocomialis]MDO7211697.1 DNA/RNA non-specific endonuclease [Acinetobacter nosocomialis]
MAVTGALGGQTDVQVVANTLAPYAANLIGSQFEHGEDKNKAAQLASHAILGATLAYLNGGNPAAGGSAAVASEAAADYFANQYNDGKTAINPETGKFDANLLPENIKTGIRDLTAAIGAVVGGTVGDSASNAQLAGVIGQNAVENNKTSIKQDIKHALTCWGLECHQQYKHLDVVQEAAYQKGKDRAVAKFVSDLKNLPNVPKEVYEAIKNDPTGTAKAIYEGLKQVPRDIIDTGKTIANVNTVGDTPAEFEKLGEADMALALNTLSGLVSAGTVTVAKKGGKIVIDASKTIKLKADFDPSLNVQTNGFSLPPKTAPKVINIKADKAKKGTKEYEVLNNPPANSHVKLDNGTEFKTNISGRIEEIEFQPSLTKNPRDSRQTAVGKQGVKGDVGGHVQACSLGGTCDNFNLFPQNSNFNNSAYKKWENEIRGALKNGDTVGKVKVSFNRTNPSNLRPDSLEVEYSINGKVKNKFFRNEANDK